MRFCHLPSRSRAILEIFFFVNNIVAGSMKHFFQIKLLTLYGAVSIILFIIYGLPYLTEQNSQSTSLVEIKPTPLFISENSSCWVQLLKYLSEKLSEDGVQANSKLQREIQNTITQIKYPNGYDVNLSAIARTRLGYATTPEFQITPNSWMNILSAKRSKILESQSEIRFIDNFNETVEEKADEGLVTARKKKILVYYSEWWFGCPKDKNPEFKCDYVFWPKLKVSTSFAETAKMFDAVVVYRDMRHQKKIILDDSNAELNPKVIYWTFEPASIPIWKSWDMQIKPRGEGGSRDLLASYWRGSDIYTPYFKWKYHDKNVISKEPTKNFAEGRTKMAAIVVSNCEPRNNRMGLVEELGEYISVDTFGKCGKTECKKKDCWKDIQKNYKFYLSFENSNCRDYITEKLFKNAWGHDLVPIVYGAHPMDYKAICPANSYIHVEDFESIEKLAEYLQVLDKNDTLYNNYFAWKGTGELRSWSFECEFCSYLHTKDMNQYPRFQSDFRKMDEQNEKEHGIPYFNEKDSYDFDVFNWSKNNTEMCLQNNQRYWNRGYK